jgi:AraC-like DNA-binding protein
MSIASFYLSCREEGASKADWLANFGPVLTSSEPVILGQDGAQNIWASRLFVASHVTCEHVNFVGSPLRSAARPLDHVAISLLLNGTVAVQADGTPSEAEAGDILLLDLQLPMRLTLGAQGRMTSLFTLWVPRAQLTAEFGGRPALHGLIGKGNLPGIFVAAAALRALLSQLDVVAAEELDELAAGIVALVGRAVSSCATSIGQRPTQSAPLESFVTLCRYVEDNLTARDLDAAKLAATFGLSRATLYRLFAPVGGVASFIRARRLARACRELTMPGLQNRRIGPIAYQAGFHSIAAFNRAFRTVYGKTPRDVRKTVGRSAPAAKLPDEMGVLARWLLDTQRHSLATDPLDGKHVAL